MTRRTGATAAALLSALLLVGCSGSDDGAASPRDEESSAAAPSVEEAGGAQVGTGEFSFNAPEGWKDVSESLPGFDPEAAYAEPEPDGFASNVNVIRGGEAGGVELDTVVDANVTQLEGGGFTDVERADDETVAGEDAAVVTAAGTQNGTDFVNRQYYLLHDDVAWVVTFSYGTDVDPAEREELAQGVMATWSWAD